MCRTEPHSRAVRGSHPPRTAAPRRSDPQRRAAGGGAHTERSPTNGGAAPPRYGTARKVQREQRRALCRGGCVQSGSERGRRSAAGTSDTERNRGAAPPGPAGRGVRRHDGVRRPNPRGSDGRRGRSGRRAARPAPPLPSPPGPLCAAAPRGATGVTRRRPAALPARSPRDGERRRGRAARGGDGGRPTAGAPRAAPGAYLDEELDDGLLVAFLQPVDRHGQRHAATVAASRLARRRYRRRDGTAAVRLARAARLRPAPPRATTHSAPGPGMGGGARGEGVV